MSRRICVITGTRADYGIFYPVMKKLESASGIDLYIIATCMHLMEKFGYTVREIEKDGFTVYEKVDISYEGDNGEAAAKSVGQAIVGFSEVFRKMCPDMILVLGDRGEMLAATIAANYMSIPVAHIHGGEVSGHVDGVLRHAVTKLSHIHLCATEGSKERIRKLGENPQRIFVVGAPALDRVLEEDFTSKEQLVEKYDLNGDERLILVLQHPVSTQEKNAAEQMEETLAAVSGFELKTIIIYPNADAGGKSMIPVIEEYEKHSFVKAFKNIAHKDYLGFLRIAAVLVGNSSSGIIEGPSFNLSVVNIGIRQRGRERSINVIDVAHDRKQITQAIHKSLFDEGFRLKLGRCENPYGNGGASSRILEILKGIEIDSELLRKRITY